MPALVKSDTGKRFHYTDGSSNEPLCKRAYSKYWQLIVFTAPPQGCLCKYCAKLGDSND